MSEYNRSFTLTGSDGTAWYFRVIAPNRYEVYLDAKQTSDQCFTTTGSDVAKYMRIPFPHRLTFAIIQHLTSTYTDSYTVMKYQLKRGTLTTTSRRLQELLTYHSSISLPNMSFHYGEGFERGESEYEITLNATNGHKIVLMFYLQKLV